MSMTINGIHHVALKCKDKATFEEAIRLYRDILELPVVRTWGTAEEPCAMIDLGGSLLEVFSNAGCQLPGGVFAHLALRTDDPDGWIDRVRQAGYTVTMEPKDIAFSCEPPAYARIAFFRGPAGEEIEFFAER